ARGAWGPRRPRGPFLFRGNRLTGGAGAGQCGGPVSLGERRKSDRERGRESHLVALAVRLARNWNWPSRLQKETQVKKFAIIVFLIFVACGSVTSWDGGGTPLPDQKAAVLPWPAGLPVYDHVMIVIEENKDYDQIIDNPKAPYINFTLREQGANFTQMFGEEHNSEGNYFWLFSGSNQNVGFKDLVPNEKNHPHYPFR